MEVSPSHMTTSQVRLPWVEHSSYELAGRGGADLWLSVRMPYSLAFHRCSISKKQQYGSGRCLSGKSVCCVSMRDWIWMIKTLCRIWVWQRCIFIPIKFIRKNEIHLDLCEPSFLSYLMSSISNQKLYYIYLVCVYLCLCVGKNTIAHKGRSRDNLWESVLSIIWVPGIKLGSAAAGPVFSILSVIVCELSALSLPMPVLGCLNICDKLTISNHLFLSVWCDFLVHTNMPVTLFYN